MGPDPPYQLVGPDPPHQLMRPGSFWCEKMRLTHGWRLTRVNTVQGSYVVHTTAGSFHYVHNHSEGGGGEQQQSHAFLPSFTTPNTVIELRCTLREARGGKDPCHKTQPSSQLNSQQIISRHEIFPGFRLIGHSRPLHTLRERWRQKSRICSRAEIRGFSKRSFYICCSAV